jgi:tape measure domain-containing protein
MTLQELLVKFGVDVQALDSGLAEVNAKVKTAAGEAKKHWDGLASMGQGLLSAGAGLTAGLTAPLVGVGAAAVSVAEDLKMAELAFTTMLGSGEKAKKFLSDLQSFAASTPFEFPDLIDAAKKMQAMGFEADKVVPTLRSIGDAAAALGGGKSFIDGVTTALGQMQAKGKVSAEEMNQLAERGVPAWKMLADNIGVSIPEAMKLSEKGAISAATAIPAILQGMNDKFGGQMAKASQTLTGVWSNFKDQLTYTLGDIGKTLTPVLTQLVTLATPLLEWVKQAAQWFANLPEPVRNGALALAAMAAAIGPILVGVGGLATALGAAMPALTALAAFLFGAGATAGALVAPALGIAAVVAALVALGTWVYQNWAPIVAVVTQAWDGLAEMWTATWNGIKGAVTGVWTSFAGAVHSIWDPVASFFSGLWNNLSWTGVWNGITSGVSGIWSGFVGLVQTLWTPARDFISGVWSGISSAWSTAWSTISSTVSGLWSGYVGFMQATWGPVIEFGKGIWNALPAAWAAAWSSVWSTVSGLWTGYLSLMQAIWGPVIQFAVDAWNGVAAAWSAVWTGIGSALSAAWSGLLSLGQTVLAPVATFVSGLWSGITEAWSAVWSGMSSMLSAAWGAIGTAANTVWAPIRAFFGSIWNGISEAFSGVWEGIKGALTTVWSAIQTSASTVWNGIVGVFQTFLSWAEKIPGVNKLMNLDEAWNSAKKMSEETDKAAKATENLKKKADAAAGGSSKPLPKLATSIGKVGKEAKETEGQLGKLIDKQTELTATAKLLADQHDKAEKSVAELKEKLRQLGSTVPDVKAPTDDFNRSLQNIIASSADLTKTTIPGVIGSVNGIIKPVNDVTAAFGTLNTKSKTDADAVAANAKLAYDAVKGSGIATPTEENNAMLKMLKAQKDAMVANGTAIPAAMQSMIDELDTTAKGPNGLGKVEGTFSTFGTNVSTMLTGLNTKFADILWNGDMSWAEKGKAALSSLKTALMDTFVAPATEALTGFVTGVLSDIIGGKGFGGIIDRVRELGKVIGDVFGIGSGVAGSVGGAAASGGAAAGGAASGTGQAAGGAASGTGQAAGGAAGQGVMGAVNMASGIVSAVSDVVTAIYSIRQEGTLNQIERNTAAGSIHLFNTLSKANQHWPKLDSIKDFLWDTFQPAFASLMTTTEALNSVVKEKLPIIESKWNQYFGYFASLMTTTEEIRDTLKEGKGGGAADIVIPAASQQGEIRITITPDAPPALLAAISRLGDGITGAVASMHAAFDRFVSQPFEALLTAADRIHDSLVTISLDMRGWSDRMSVSMSMQLSVLGEIRDHVSSHGGILADIRSSLHSIRDLFESQHAMGMNAMTSGSIMIRVPVTLDGRVVGEGVAEYVQTKLNRKLNYASKV